MKRYNYELCTCDVCQGSVSFVEAEDGDYVFYDDAVADRAALVAQLEAANKLHEQALNERDAAHSALESERADHDEFGQYTRCQALVARLEAAERACEAAVAGNALATRRAREAEARVRELTEALAAMTSESDSLHMMCDTEHAKLNAAESECAALRAEVERLTAHRERLAVEAGQLRADWGRHVAEIATLKKELAETTDDALKQRVEYWRESSQASEARLAAANALLSRCLDDFAGSVATPAEADRIVADIRAHLAAQPATALQRSIEAAEREVPEWRRDAAAEDFPVSAPHAAPATFAHPGAEQVFNQLQGARRRMSS